MHVALARKYRPKAFGDLVAQEHVARALRGAVEQGRAAHGYLFAGPRGVGKTTAARILAMALNCETRHLAAASPRRPEPDSKGTPGVATSGEPCGECVTCRRIWEGSASLDVIEIDAASNRGVDDARDLRERAMYAASQEGRHKIYIVDEAHMLTREAWNTLLKILEEPPPGVHFVFATTEPHKITNTAAPVMSRLQRFDFRRVGPQAIAARLTEVAAAERLEADADAIELIARVADGGLRDALSMLDQVTAFGEGRVTSARVREVLGLVGDEVFAELFAIVAERRPQDVFPFVARLAEAGVDLIAFAEGAGDLWRAALAMRLGAKPDGISAALTETIRARAPDLAVGDYLRILRALAEAEEPIRRSGMPRLALETLLVRWALMDRTVEIAELLKGVGAPTATVAPAPTPRERAGSARDEPPAAVPPAPPAGRVLRDTAPAIRSPGPATPASALRQSGPLTLEAVRELWPDVIAAARAERKMMVAEALTDVDVESLEGNLLGLAPKGGNPLTPESLTRNQGLIEVLASRVLGAAVLVAEVGRPTAEAGREGPPSAPSTKAQRVTVSGAKAERAKAFRGKDPALDSAMDALDLELLE
jgi:DNA polymerase-3 subunit gamma/tau